MQDPHVVRTILEEKYISSFECTCVCVCVQKRDREKTSRGTNFSMKTKGLAGSLACLLACLPGFFHLGILNVNRKEGLGR